MGQHPPEKRKSSSPPPAQQSAYLGIALQRVLGVLEALARLSELLHALPILLLLLSEEIRHVTR